MPPQQPTQQQPPLPPEPLPEPPAAQPQTIPQTQPATPQAPAPASGASAQMLATYLSHVDQASLNPLILEIAKQLAEQFAHDQTVTPEQYAETAYGIVEAMTSFDPQEDKEFADTEWYKLGERIRKESSPDDVRAALVDIGKLAYGPEFGAQVASKHDAIVAEEAKLKEFYDPAKHPVILHGEEEDKPEYAVPPPGMQPTPTAQPATTAPQPPQPEPEPEALTLPTPQPEATPQPPSQPGELVVPHDEQPGQ